MPVSRRKASAIARWKKRKMGEDAASSSGTYAVGAEREKGEGEVGARELEVVMRSAEAHELGTVEELGGGAGRDVGLAPLVDGAPRPGKFWIGEVNRLRAENSTLRKINEELVRENENFSVQNGKLLSKNVELGKSLEGAKESMRDYRRKVDNAQHVLRKKEKELTNVMEEKNVGPAQKYPKEFERQSDWCQRRTVKELVTKFECLSAGSESVQKCLLKRVTRKMGLPAVFDSVQMTPREDCAMVTSAGLSWGARSMLKRDMLQRGINYFAADNKVWSFKREHSRRETFEETPKFVDDGVIVSVLEETRLQERLNERIGDLQGKGKLRWDDPFEGKLWLCVVGDKGGDKMKLCVFVGNMEDSNSVEHQMLVAEYTGNDDGKAMRVALSSIAKQINGLTTVYVVSDAETETREVVKFITGDVKFLCSVMGHRGSSSSHPCLFCNLPKIDMQRGGILNYRDQSGVLRTKNSISTRVDSWDHDPIFDIPFSNIIPPSLHIFMGAFDIILEKLDELSMMKDNPMYTAPKGDMKKRMSREIREFTEELEALRAREEALSSEESNLNIIHVIYSQRVKRGVMPQGDVSFTCPALGGCALTDRRSGALKVPETNNGWVRYTGCNQLFHQACECVVSENDLQQPFLCGRCSEFDLFVKCARLLRRLKGLREELNCCKENVVKVENEISTRYGELRAQKGVHCKRLDGMMARLGADRKAFYQSFCGNHVRKLLKENAANVLWGLFPEFAMAEQYVSLQITLGELQSFARARFLDDVETSNFRSLLTKFLELLVRVDPERSLTPKLHMLLCHVPAFIEKWKTWGLMCEQPIEAFHALYNRLSRRFGGIRDVRRRRLAIAHAISFSTFLRDCS